ncbi:MAG TPA: lipid II flippase MurJ, partial [Pantoea sp.]|nr:lipid II flippase MurJ [Pantoea sp.]
LLYWQLRKKNIFQPQPGWASFLLRLVIAVSVMAAALLGILYLMPAWEEGAMVWRLLRLAAVCAVGGGAYFLTLGLL